MDIDVQVKVTCLFAIVLVAILVISVVNGYKIDTLVDKAETEPTIEDVIELIEEGNQKLDAHLRVTAEHLRLFSEFLEMEMDRRGIEK